MRLLFKLADGWDRFEVTCERVDQSALRLNFALSDVLKHIDVTRGCRSYKVPIVAED